MRVSPGTAFRGVLALLWLGLVVYVVAQGDPVGYIIVVVVGVFVGLPVLVLSLVGRGDRSEEERKRASREWADDERDTSEPR